MDGVLGEPVVGEQDDEEALDGAQLGSRRQRARVGVGLLAGAQVVDQLATVDGRPRGAGLDGGSERAALDEAAGVWNEQKERSSACATMQSPSREFIRRLSRSLPFVSQAQKHNSSD